MVYRSRYLNRLMFSPPSYRERFRQVAPRTEPIWAGAAVSARMVDAADVGPAVGAVAGAAALTAPQGDLSERAPYLPSRELRDTLHRCEQVITAGRARIEDYEAFIICQQELASRA